MKKLSLEKYKPIISDKDIGDEIYNHIKTILSKGEKVEIDMGEIKSMATFCSKQIFGKIYIELGPANFFEKVIIRNASNDIKSIIKIGIQNAILETK